MTETITDLVGVYGYWQAGQGLRLGSADEHVHDPDLTEDQRDWLRRFVERWDAALAAEVEDVKCRLEERALVVTYLERQLCQARSWRNGAEEPAAQVAASRVVAALTELVEDAKREVK